MEKDVYSLKAAIRDFGMKKLLEFIEEEYNYLISLSTAWN